MPTFPTNSNQPFDIVEILKSFPAETVPDELIHFTSPKGLDILRNGEFRITPPRFFNDPFELKPSVANNDIPDEEIKAYLEKCFQKRALSEKWSESQFKDFVSQGISNGSEMAWACVKSHITALRDLFSQYFGIGCFSDWSKLKEEPDEIRHWSFYGQNHTGIALVFDGQHSFFKLRRDARLLFKVNYNPTRSACSLRDFSHDHTLEESLKHYRKWAAEKSTSWEPEQEWRFFFPLSGDDNFPVRQHLDGERVNHLIRLWSHRDNSSENSRILKKVILGAGASADLKISVRALLQNDRLEHVQRWEAREDPHQFKLSYHRVT